MAIRRRFKTDVMAVGPKESGELKTETTSSPSKMSTNQNAIGMHAK